MPQYTCYCHYRDLMIRNQITILGFQFVTAPDYQGTCPGLFQYLGTSHSASTLNYLGYISSGLPYLHTFAYDVNLTWVRRMFVEVYCLPAQIEDAEHLIRSLFGSFSGPEGDNLQWSSEPFWRDGLPGGRQGWPPRNLADYRNHREREQSVPTPRSNQNGGYVAVGLALGLFLGYLFFARHSSGTAGTVNPAPGATTVVTFSPATIVPNAIPPGNRTGLINPCAQGCKQEPISECPNLRLKAFVFPDGRNSTLYYALPSHASFAHLPFDPVNHAGDFWFCTTQQAEAKGYRLLPP